MELRYIESKREGRVAVGYLNKPKANTYDPELMRDLNDWIDDVRYDDEVDVAVLTSKSEGMFSAGADINFLRASTPDHKATFCLGCQETLNKMESTPKLFIAALNGHTVGGGLEIALACDLRFMTDGTYKIGLPEVTLGVLPGTGGTQRLPRLIGKSKAIDLMVTGRLLTPREALQIGLVDRVWPQADFWRETLNYASSLCSPNHAARAVGFIKRSVHEGTEMSIKEGLSLERELQNRLFAMDDAKEGFTAFIEKRKAVFKGH
ncbi:MAG: enoyl-CoA hydratase/isomerase family protein [Euryarchaeota archaeon]|nr:enoyl-CoA hydratase/isomerase family protein [Euryarchaeota archaeon]